MVIACRLGISLSSLVAHYHRVYALSLSDIGLSRGGSVAQGWLVRPRHHNRFSQSDSLTKERAAGERAHCTWAKSCSYLPTRPLVVLFGGRLGAVLDQDRSTKSGMRTRTAVFLAFRTVVPAILHFTQILPYFGSIKCLKFILKVKFIIEI